MTTFLVRRARGADACAVLRAIAGDRSAEALTAAAAANATVLWLGDVSIASAAPLAAVVVGATSRGVVVEAIVVASSMSRFDALVAIARLASAARDQPVPG